MSSSVDRWIHAEGRLGEPALREPAGSDGPRPEPYLVCWRCGAVRGDTSPCTEKRGSGPPWRHQFLNPEHSSEFAWRDYADEELYRLALYFSGKARSSLLTANAFADLVRFGDELGIDRTRQQGHAFALALYREKAAKRIRLFDWTLTEYERRLKEERDAASHSDPS